VDINWQ